MNSISPVATSHDLTVYLDDQQHLIIKRDKKFAEVDTALDQLEQELTPDLFKQGLFDQKIEDCLALLKKLDDMEGLRRLAHILFAHKPYPSPEERVLYYMLNCFEFGNDHRFPTFKIDYILLIMKAALVNFKKEESSTDKKIQELVQEKYWSQDFPQTYSIKPRKPTDLVDVSHGGGVYYLKSVFNGQKQGYFGGCLFVCPVDEMRKRDLAYATRTAPTKFDRGFVIKGQIQAQYLKPADNAYEALLPIKNLSKMTISNLQFTADPKISEFPIIGVAVKEVFERHKDLQSEPDPEFNPQSKKKTTLQDYIQRTIDQKLEKECESLFFF